MRDDRYAAEGPEATPGSAALLEEVLQNLPPTDRRLYRYLDLLRRQLAIEEQQHRQALQAIAEYEEAYRQLTAPSNRVGIYLGPGKDGAAHVAVGDTEYFANVDPTLALDRLQVGTRVRLNEAFAVVGDLGYPEAGPIVKVSDLLDEERLRVALDAQGSSTRVVVRSADSREAP